MTQNNTLRTLQKHIWNEYAARARFRMLTFKQATDNGVGEPVDESLDEFIDKYIDNHSDEPTNQPIDVWDLSVSLTDPTILKIPRSASIGCFFEIRDELCAAGIPCDIVIKCEKIQYQAHLAVLAEHSTLFQELAKAPPLGPLKREVDLSRLKFRGVLDVLHYIYTGFYRTWGTSLGHVSAYVAAVDLGVVGMKDRALADTTQCFEKILCRYPQLDALGSYDTILDADIYAVKVIFLMTKRDDPLREHIVRLCLKHAIKTKRHPELVELLSEHEPIAWKLGLDMQQVMQEEKTQAVSRALVLYRDSDLYRAAVRADAERMVEEEKLMSKKVEASKLPRSSPFGWLYLARKST